MVREGGGSPPSPLCLSARSGHAHLMCRHTKEGAAQAKASEAALLAAQEASKKLLQDAEAKAQGRVRAAEQRAHEAERQRAEAGASARIAAAAELSEFAAAVASELAGVSSLASAGSEPPGVEALMAEARSEAAACAAELSRVLPELRREAAELREGVARDLAGARARMQERVARAEAELERERAERASWALAESSLRELGGPEGLERLREELGGAARRAQELEGQLRAAKASECVGLAVSRTQGLGSRLGCCDPWSCWPRALLLLSFLTFPLLLLPPPVSQG
jgi:hypothetical protein